MATQKSVYAFFATAVDLNKCFKQFKWPNKMYTGVIISELPCMYITKCKIIHILETIITTDIKICILHSATVAVWDWEFIDLLHFYRILKNPY